MTKCHIVGNHMSRLNYVLSAQKNRLIETVLLSTHNILFCLKNKKNPFHFLGLLRVSEFLDIRGSEYKIKYEYSSLPKSLDRNLFFLTTEIRL